MLTHSLIFLEERTIKYYNLHKEILLDEWTFKSLNVIFNYLNLLSL